MTKQTIFKRIISVLLIAVLLSAAIFGMYRHNVFAVFNPDSAMKYSEYAGSHTIEDSTLFYGTWLISLSAMTDELYQKAEESASETNQTEMYYKSELAGGSWFDVTDGEGLSDIMGTGTVIDESELADLYVQYHVTADGTVTDVMNEAEINPFDIPDPYNLSKLPELQSLWIQYTNSETADGISEEDYLENKNSENSGNQRVDVYNYQILTSFFSLDLRDSETDELDADLARLWACHKSLKGSGQDEEAEILYSLMKKVDSKRRAIVMDKLAGMETNALGVLTSLANGKYYTTFGDFGDPGSSDNSTEVPDFLRDLEESVDHSFEEDDDGSNEWWGALQEEYDDHADDDDDEKPSHVFQTDSSLLDAIADGSSACQKSLNTYNADALTDDDSVLGHANYEYSSRVIEEASADGAAGPINYLRDVMNIQEGTVKNKDSELTLIDRSFLNLAESKYEEEVTSGEGDEYMTLLSQGVGDAAAESALNTQFDNTERRRSELEFLIDAYKQRESAANAYTYVEGAIEWSEGLYPGIPQDEFSAKATGSVDSHIKWLKDLKDSIKAGDESLKDDLDKLKDKKEDLQKQRDSALDDNDLAKAAQLDKSIEAVDQDIADEEARSGNSDTDSLKDNILSDALDQLAKDPDADISGAANALAGMGDKDAVDKLKDRAEDSGASSEQLDNLDDAADKAAEGGDEAGGDGSGKDGSGKDGSGSGGSGDRTRMSESDLLDIIGKDLKDLNMKELAYTTAALSRFSQQGCKAAGTLAGKCTEIGRETGNKYFYQKYKEKTPEYISLQTLGEVSEYRYYYDNSRKEATMTRGGTVYIFEANSDKVNMAGADSNLKYATGFSKYPYISEDDADVLFKCEAEYVNDTSYAVCLTEELESKAEELLAEFTGE